MVTHTFPVDFFPEILGIYCCSALEIPFVPPSRDHPHAKGNTIATVAREALLNSSNPFTFGVER